MTKAKIMRNQMHDSTAALLSIHVEVSFMNLHGNVIAKTHYQEQNHQSTIQVRTLLRLLTKAGHWAARGLLRRICLGAHPTRKQRMTNLDM